MLEAYLSNLSLQPPRGLLAETSGVQLDSFLQLHPGAISPGDRACFALACECRLVSSASTGRGCAVRKSSRKTCHNRWEALPLARAALHTGAWRIEHRFPPDRTLSRRAAR